MEGRNKTEKETQKPARKIQWHPAFVAAMKLELREYSEYLYFESEHVLNKGAIAADLLLIKKENISMENYDWGEFLGRHNLIEYKGIGAALNWKVFSKGLAYAYLYVSQEKKDEDRNWDEVTLTFLRRAKPVKLLKMLKKNNFSVEKADDGVYYIGNKLAFKVQIIVLKEVSFERHPWLSALSRDLNAENLMELFRWERKLAEGEDRSNAEAVMEVVARANKEIFKQIGDDEIMGEALMELVKPRIDVLLAEKDAEMAEKVAEKDEELQIKDAQLQSIDKKLKNSENKLREEEAENSRLRKEVENLKKQLNSVNKIAML